MKHDPNTPSLVNLTEQLIAHSETIQREDNVQTLARLVEEHGYRKASIITGRSRGYLWARLRPKQAAIPRGRGVVKTIEVQWLRNSTARTDISSEPAIIGVLRQNLETFLNRAERIGKLSTMADRKAKTMEAHLKRINTSLARLALLQLKHAERAIKMVPWQTLSPEDVARVFLFIANLQERIVQILAVMLLWRDPEAFPEIPQHCQVSPPNIVICRQTLRRHNSRRNRNMTYENIAAIHHTTREQIKKTETEALRKLKRLLKSEWNDLNIGR